MASCTCKSSMWQRQAAAPLAAGAGRAPAPAVGAQPQQRRRGDAQVVHADAAILQEVIVGGAVTAATAAAMMNGLSKGEPEICPTCSGTGAQAPCLVCNGEGKTKAPMAASGGRSALVSREGRSSSRECRVCAGVGIIYCKTCGGSGYTKRM